jgi:hypothetical protein
MSRLLQQLHLLRLFLVNLLLIGVYANSALAQPPGQEDAVLERELAWLRNPRGFLGMWTDYRSQAGSEQGAFEVTKVEPELPAAKAGIRTGDLIIEVNRVPFRFDSQEAAREAWDWLRPGDQVRLTVLRDGERFEPSLTAVDFPGWPKQRFQERIRQVEGMLGENLLLRWVMHKGAVRLHVKRPDESTFVVAVEGFSAEQLDRLAALLETTPVMVKGLGLTVGADKTFNVSQNAQGMLRWETSKTD